MAAGETQWDGKSRGGRTGYRIFVSIIRLLGINCAYGLLAFIAVYFIPFAPKATRSSWIYSRRHRGLGFFKSMIEVYRHYFVFGQVLIDKLALQAGMTDRYKFEFDNYDRFIEIINGNEGVVIIGAHVGCWEAGASFFGKYGKKINIVMYDTEHQRIKEVVDNNTSRESGYKVIPINEDSLGAMIEIRRALGEAEYVCFNGDRYTDPKTSVPRDFLGSQAQFTLGPFMIGVKTRAPIVFYYAMREKGRRYRFVFEEVKSLEGRLTVDYVHSRYLASLENIVRKYPLQWFNFYDFWNDKTK